MAGRVRLRKRSRLRAPAVRTRISGLRAQLRGLYGDDVLAVIGLDKAAAPTREPLALLRQAQHLSDRLRDPALQGT